MSAEGEGLPGRLHSGQGSRARDQARQPGSVHAPGAPAGEAQVDFGFAVAKVAGVFTEDCFLRDGVPIRTLFL